MAELFAGTSGWAYTSWKPDFYPEKLAASRLLQFYGTRLNTVEVNYTFRHYASEKSQRAWIAATPPPFQFSVKAHQRITHILRLKNAAEEVKKFLATLQPLHESGRLGIVLFQLPPNLKSDLALLSDFLAALPTSGRFAMEFRHASWLDDPAFEVLRERSVALCVAEAEGLITPEVVTSEICYYRLRQSDYAVAERKRVAKQVKSRLAEGKNVFAYFKHEETPQGAFLAEELLHAVRPVKKVG